MEEIAFTPGSVPVVVVARVYGKDASWVPQILIFSTMEGMCSM